MKPSLPDPLPDDPLPLLKAWIDEALKEIRNATAMTLATVEPDGRPEAGTHRDPAADIDLGRALETVPREARLLLALHYVDGLSYQELAAIRGISVNTVKSQLTRGKTILKRELKKGIDDGSD